MIGIAGQFNEGVKPWQFSQRKGKAQLQRKAL